MRTALLMRGAGTELLAQLEDELERLQLLAVINRIVGREVSAWINDDDDRLDLIVEDVAQRWSAREDSDPQVLDGPNSFWSRYANQVEFAPPETGNEYRAEFCLGDPDAPFDTDDYFRAVWAAHVADLRTMAESLKTTT